MSDKKDSCSIIIICPHCNNSVIIEEINCAIFRHGILKSNGQQMNPHTPKIECDNLINNNLIYGCGKPFKIEIKPECLADPNSASDPAKINSELVNKKAYNAIQCDYI